MNKYRKATPGKKVFSNPSTPEATFLCHEINISLLSLQNLIGRLNRVFRAAR